MAYHGRKFFEKETIEEKTRKYTRPYPIVTSQLRTLQQSLFAPPVLRSPIHMQVPNQIIPVSFQMRGPMQVVPQQQSNVFSRKRRQDNTQITFSGSDSSPNKRRKPLSTEVNQSRKTNVKFEQLTEEIINYSETHKQSDKMLQKKLHLRSALLTLIRKDYPTASLHLVGSSCNGFATDSSDADFCVMFTQERKVDQRYEACMYLQHIQRAFRTISSIKHIQLIRATVPILKFEDSISGCECDLNINNPTGIRNTHLMRTYSKVDDRVRPMVMIVKRWAKARDINDASVGTLSSYSIVLMVLNYLQSGCDPPVLNSLQMLYPDFFNPTKNVDELPMFEPADLIQCNRSRNKQSVGELLKGFFNYYTNIFDYETTIMSVRLGRKLPRSSLPAWRGKWICIEEPFDLTNTARAVRNYTYYSQIIDEFRRAHNRMNVNMSLDNIL